MKDKHYSLSPILARKATYNIIIGERSNGKTYAALKYILEQYAEHGRQAALLRRWVEDFTGTRGQQMFSALVSNGEIENITEGQWTDIYYYGSKWYLCNWLEDGKRCIDEKPFCYGFALTSMEHDKSVSFPNITTIVFDEFISRSAYIPDEFVLYMNCLSTIIRQRDNVTIFMLGNTVNKYCPYYQEMGLSHIKQQKQGTIDLYQYGDSKLTVAVEYCQQQQKSKPSDHYFAFDNPRLNMITGGAWEIDIYPHCPHKYRPKDVVFRYYIIFQGDTLEAEIVVLEDQTFTFIHPKTTEIKSPETQVIYSTDFSPYPQHHRNITKPVSAIEKKIASYYKQDKVFYSSNEVGEIVRNYLLWSTKSA